MSRPMLFSYEVDEVRPPPRMQVLGSGRVGGKARGLAFAAHQMHVNPASIAGEHMARVRIPRAVFVCSGVYEEFVDDNHLADLAGEASFEVIRQRFNAGVFREQRQRQFLEVLENLRYPLAIRSSSAFEDDIEHAFAGIYLTTFMANNGTRTERLQAFENAVKEVYASTWNDSARAYRRKRGLPDADERMSIVVQRMVGRKHRHLMFPGLAGVAFSRNYYPWSPDIRREEGLMRLVYGLGTRAVGRNYARVVSLSHPALRPEGHVVEDIERYSQEEFDALNLRTDRLVSIRIQAVARLDSTLPLFTSVVRNDEYLLDDVVLPQRDDRTILTFNHLLGPRSPIPLIDLVRTLLQRLEQVCGLPVDIEFAVDFPASPSRRPSFHLLQLRPLGVRRPQRRVRVGDRAPETVLLSSTRTIGNAHTRRIPNLIYVRPDRYLAEPAAQTARRIGELNDQLASDGYVLVGPGRWGTRNEQLGVPVDYAQICHVRALVEVSLAGFTPELSYGTHFFGDLFADDVPYIAVFPEHKDRFGRAWLESVEGEERGPAVRWIRKPEGFGVVVDGRHSRGMVYIHAST